MKRFLFVSFLSLCNAHLLPAKFSKDKKSVTVNLALPSGQTVAFPRVEPLLFTPDGRILYIHNFLTDSECEHLITRALPKLHRSTVVDGQGGGVLNDIRTSAGTFLDRRSDPIVSRINDRLALITLFPVDFHEDIQILRYEPGQHYLPHMDAFSTAAEKSEYNGLQRVATLLIYLNSWGVDYEGGETTFPLVGPSEAQSSWSNVSACTRGKLAVRPKKGDAVLFFSLSPSGDEMQSSMHGSCDVLWGTKYSAPTWTRQKPFHPSSLRAEGPSGCRDVHEQCMTWARSGECANNSDFMLEECARACGQCPPPSA